VFGHSSASRRQDGLQLATILAVMVAVITPAQALLDGRLPEGVALMVGAAGLTVGLASQALQAFERRRQAQASREAAVAALLSPWPLPVARDVDPYDLGVDPPRDPAEDLPYIARDADAEVRAGLREAPFLLVTGPRLSGKTRTAFEALVAERPDARVIVPRSASAFARLVALEHPPELRDSSVLWLDGLGDFLREGGLDGRVLDDAAAMRPPMTIVATLSEEERAALLREGGEVARRTRMVLADATVVTVAGALSGAEQARAAKLYDRPVVGLVGANFAADAHLLAPPLEVPEPAPPPPPSAPAPAVRPRRIATPAIVRRARRWRVGLIGAIVAPLALLMPIAALPAVVCGGVLLWRRQLARGVALIAAAIVFAVGGIGLVAALEQPIPTPTPVPTVVPTPSGLTDSQVLARYFVARFAACQRAATPEYPNCAIVLNPVSQREWVDNNGYTACRATGGSPEDCVGRLP
jgi:hypothetical protein